MENPDLENMEIDMTQLPNLNAVKAWKESGLALEYVISDFLAEVSIEDWLMITLKMFQDQMYRGDPANHKLVEDIRLALDDYRRNCKKTYTTEEFLEGL